MATTFRYGRTALLLLLAGDQQLPLSRFLLAGNPIAATGSRELVNAEQVYALDGAIISIVVDFNDGSDELVVSEPRQ